MDWFKSQTIFFPWDSNSNLSSDFHLSFQIKERGVVANKLETLSTMSQHRHTKQIMRLEALCLNGRTFDGKNMYANIKFFCGIERSLRHYSYTRFSRDFLEKRRAYFDF